MKFVVVVLIGLALLSICSWIERRANKDIPLDGRTQIQSETTRLNREWIIVMLLATPAWLVILVGVEYFGRWLLLPVPVRPIKFMPMIIAEIYRMHRTSLLAWPRNVMAARLAMSVIAIAMYCVSGYLLAFTRFF